METSLHRELKRIYAGEGALLEVRLAGYRIDAVVDGELVEIQHGSLAAIRNKVRELLTQHRVRVVKPLIASKVLVKRRRKGGAIVERRMSPKRATILDLFDELVYFTQVFPNPRLSLEVPLVEIEEWRYPGHGRRRRRRLSDHIVEDQKLIRIQHTVRLHAAGDLSGLIGCNLPSPFDSGQLAAGLSIARQTAQRITYCLRKMGAAEVVGKRGNAHLYEITRAAVRAA